MAYQWVFILALVMMVATFVFMVASEDSFGFTVAAWVVGLLTIAAFIFAVVPMHDRRDDLIRQCLEAGGDPIIGGQYAKYLGCNMP